MAEKLFLAVISNISRPQCSECRDVLWYEKKKTFQVITYIEGGNDETTDVEKAVTRTSSI